ncbi:MAG: hypothetical protein H0U76_14830 [Ktedonobacteraceae bacterium]|nr:hypothetical protein [Ktedonobacteraceae bacterium]MBA3822560.1 hypothetical protein [Ktedonobacterales bacterium]
MPAMQFCILGDFRLTYDHQPITALTAQRLRALLALHHTAAQQRHNLAFLFWPDGHPDCEGDWATVR